MNRDLDANRLALLRLLRNELPPEQAAALRRRVASEPALADLHRRLAAAWDGLALPQTQGVPLGFSGRVMTRVREAADERGAVSPGAAVPAGGPRLSWSSAPRWVRAAGAAALLAGALLGAGLGASAPDAAGSSWGVGAVGTLGMDDDRPVIGGLPALTEGYRAMVDESAGAPAALPSSPPPPMSTRGEAGR